MSSPPAWAGEDALRHRGKRCDQVPRCAVRLFALPRAAQRHQGRDEAWDFERAPVNATKGCPEANPNYVATVSGASFFRAKRLRHEGPSLSRGTGSREASLTR